MISNKLYQYECLYQLLDSFSSFFSLSFSLFSSFSPFSSFSSALPKQRKYRHILRIGRCAFAYLFAPSLYQAACTVYCTTTSLIRRTLPVSPVLYSIKLPVLLPVSPIPGCLYVRTQYLYLYSVRVLYRYNTATGTSTAIYRKYMVLQYRYLYGTCTVPYVVP